MYQYISDDEHSYTLKGKDGKEFKVAKQSISDAIHGKITNMKPVKMANGGEVPAALDPNYQQIDQMLTPNLNQEASAYPDPVAVAYENRLKNSLLEKEGLQNKDLNPFPTPEDFMSPSQININAQKDALSYANLHKQKLDGGVYTSPNPDSIAQQQSRLDEQKQNLGVGGFKQPQLETPEMALQKQLQAQSQLPQVEQQQSNYNFPQSQMLGLMQGASAPLMRNAKAQEDMYKTQADMYGKMGDQADEFKTQADNMQKAKQDVGDEYDKLFNDVKNQKIDPYKVWNDSSTGQKAGIVVGMLLSGLGQGLQGPGATNMAMDAYNKQVDRSIESQKMELGKKENLLSQNLRRYGDLHTAEAATRAAYMTAMGAKISQAGAMAQSKEAKSNAQLQLIDINSKILPLMAQVTNATAMAKAYGMGNNAGGIPVQQEPFGLLSNPEYMKKRVVFNNRAYPAVDDKAAEELRNMLSKYSGIKTMVNELSDISKKNNGVALGPVDRARVEQIRSQLIPENMSYDDFKRLTKEDLENFGKSFSNPNSVMGFVEGDVRNKQFLKHLDESLNEAMKNKLVKFNGMPGQGFQPLGKAKGR